MTTATALRVEIGPARDGTKLGDDWTTVGLVEAEHKCVWGYHKLPFDDDSVDELYASHVIEHIPWWVLQDAVYDAFRIVRPGGMIEIHTIDFRKVVDQYMFGSCGDWEGKEGLPGTEPLLWVANRLISYGGTPGSRKWAHEDANWHRSILDRPYLHRLLATAGFEQIEDAGEPRGPEKHGVANMGVKAVKP